MLDKVKINDTIEGTSEVEFIESLRGEELVVINKDVNDPAITIYFLRTTKGIVFSPHITTMQVPFPFVDADLAHIE